MFRGGKVSGSVTLDNNPVVGACVNVVVVDNNNWQWLAGTQSGPDGTFTLGPVVGENITISVDRCQSSTTILSGVYAGPDQPLTRNNTHAATMTVGPTASVTNLILGRSSARTWRAR